jgi:DNA polymerase-1
MITAVASGAPYLGFAKQARLVPADATRASHSAIRDTCKTCVLGVGCGMESDSLAQRLGITPVEARELLERHRHTWPRFWQWSDAAVDHAMLHGHLDTLFGWRVHVGPDANPRSLRNFPMQANGAEMLRLACCLAAERGVAVCAPVHDAILIEADRDRVDEDVAVARAAMAEASRIVLGGFELRTDAKLVFWPHRYADPRGVAMWHQVCRILDQVAQRPSCLAV